MQSVRYPLSQALLLLSIAWLVTFSSANYAQEYATQQNLDWHYTIRPKDTLPSISDRLLKPQHTWSSVAHYNHIKDVERLQVGSILKLPITWLKHQPIPAKVIEFDGVALIKRRQNTRYNPVSHNNLLYVGDELLTREGYVIIEFANESQLRLDERSHLIFNKLSNYQSIGMVDTRMRLGRGGLSTQVSPLTKGSRYEISTPSAVAAVRGTEFRLRTNPMGTALEVLEGTVEFIHKHGKELIEHGNGARVFAQSALLERINLRTLPRQKSDHPQYAKSELLEWKGLPQTFDTASLDHQHLKDVDNHSKNSLNSTAQPSSNKQEGELEASEPAILNLPLPGSIIDSFTAEFSWRVNQAGALSRFELSKDKNFERLALPSQWADNTTFRLEQHLDAGNYFWRVRTMQEGKSEGISATRSVSIQGMLDEVNILTVNYVGDQVGIFWHTVEHANGYILQVSDDKEFRRLDKEETLSKTSAFLKLPEGKRFYARVKGLGDEVYNANFGPHKEIFLEPTPESAHDGQ